MKRAQEKIKDIVEPQVFDEVQNLAADPARALAAYRFTDATSDLLARWLDSLSDLPRGRGAARALAGARGVGKSHTLAVFGALAGDEHLRAGVDDAHAATSARRLSARRYTVARVERGTRPTLAEEMAVAFTKTFGGNEIQWGTDAAEMLAVAAARAVDATLVVVIDTAFNRPGRVRRDDGPVLAQLAVVTQGTSAFVALALDDDISGADGPNVAIAGTYQIDFLDQEHLFRVADRYILRKNEQARAVLHDLYLHLRAMVPGFNWSEPRFALLYPVHPLVAEVAPSVRLYAPAFAFLPFAAEAARRATSRPALSLILLDEVFDRVEKDLRRSTELQEAFATYDELATRGVAQFPVMQRLQAKIVLKSLFILSLDGAGATASGLCAALLASDESSPSFAVERMKEFLTRFADIAPQESLARTEEAGDGGETRYRLQIGASDKFKAALDAAAERHDADVAAALALLRAFARTRFDDWPFSDEPEAEPKAADFHLTWRGSARPGRLVWDGADAHAKDADAAAREWLLTVLAPDADPRTDATNTSASPVKDGVTSPVVDGGAASAVDDVTKGLAEVEVAPFAAVWRPAAVSTDELATLRRLLALRADADLAASFGEAAHAARSTLSAQAERVWTRVYVDDSVLEIAGQRAPFSDRARGEASLSAVLSEALAPHLEARYPEHPQFAETLGDAEADVLVTRLFAAAEDSDTEVQRLARLFAEPLGLVARRGAHFALETGEGVGDERAWTKELLKLVKASGDETLPLVEARALLRRPPFGLGRVAQNLVLAALVAQRRVELITTSGEHISRRKLASPVRWESVASLCRTARVHQSAEELTVWARRLTGCETLATVSDTEARKSARRALSEWLEEWGALRFKERLAELPDAALTTEVWEAGRAVERGFGAAAEASAAALARDITLEEGLERVADAFKGSAETFARLSSRLDALTRLLDEIEERERARAYLSAAEPTGVAEIETARRELLSATQDARGLLDAERGERFLRLWREFQTRYADHYARLHEETVGASADRRALHALLGDYRWREFEALSQLPVVNQRVWREAETAIRRADLPRCTLPVRSLLDERPRCACRFTLASAHALGRLPRELEERMELGLAAYQRTLTLFGGQLQHALEALAARDEERRDVATRARLLAAAFGGGTPPARFSRADVRLIERAIASMETPPPVRVTLPTEGCGLLTREELSARLRQWLDDLPDHTSFFELAATGASQNEG
ncbi:MAG TPA: DUF6079 family protein [Pyrinomonadaceae bacterium]|nr:DUF6079 family protein [Pyrinomonadaceae bacterium]